MASPVQLKVLVADDRREVRSALRLVLQQTSKLAVVGEAATLEAALAALESLAPDILLLDWELPANGPRVTMQTLKAQHPGLKIVTMSSRSAARQEALLAGVDAFVSKGDPAEYLLATLLDLSSMRCGGNDDDEIRV
ncbi:MAG: response regulator [Anaerolineae bacterium]